jgi:hypothetical protein
MERGSPVDCNHERDEERGWHCCLNSVDLEAALEDDGGRVARCYEILCWNPKLTRTDLFHGMIKNLIALKVQSKAGVETLSGEQRQGMADAWSEVGVKLLPDAWNDSPARYLLTKILLNR